MEQLQDGVCHSQADNNCEGCHIDGSESKDSLFLEHNIKLEKPDDDDWQESNNVCEGNQGGYNSSLHHDIKTEIDYDDSWSSQVNVKLETQEMNWMENVGVGVHSSSHVDVKCECGDDEHAMTEEDSWPEQGCLDSSTKKRKSNYESKKKEEKICPICFEFFPSNLLLLRHEKTVHYHERPKVCNIRLPSGELCLKRFKNNGSLMMHAKSHAKDASSNTTSSNKSIKKAVEQTKQTKPTKKSRVIKSEASTKEKAAETFKVLGDVLISTASLPPPVQELSKQSAGMSFRNFHTCKVCLKIFSDSNDLKMHALTHRVMMPFSCNVCSQSFFTGGELIEHEKTHSDVKPAKIFFCKVCAQTFNDKSALEFHATTHSRACSVCKEVFSDSNALKMHALSHRVVMPFSCKDCNQSFRTGGELIEHEKHHCCN